MLHPLQHFPQRPHSACSSEAEPPAPAGLRIPPLPGGLLAWGDAVGLSGRGRRGHAGRGRGERCRTPGRQQPVTLKGSRSLSSLTVTQCIISLPYARGERGPRARRRPRPRQHVWAKPDSSGCSAACERGLSGACGHADVLPRGLWGSPWDPRLRQPCAGSGCSAQSCGLVLRRTDPAPFPAHPPVGASCRDAREGSRVQTLPR